MNIWAGRARPHEQLHLKSAFERMSEVWSNDVKIVENQYDPFGRRVRKVMPEETHTFVWNVRPK